MPEPEEPQTPEPEEEQPKKKPAAEPPPGMFSDLTAMQAKLSEPVPPPPRWFKVWLNSAKQNKRLKLPMGVLGWLLRYLGYLCTGVGVLAITVSLMARHAIHTISGAQVHYSSFLHRWWKAFASAVGSNSLGITLVIVEPIATLVVAGFVLAALRGWEEMKKELVKSVLLTFLITLAVQIVLFGPSFIQTGIETVYDDHQSLASANRTLSAEIAPLKQENEELKKKIPVAFTEPTNSLRRRTIRLANELYIFLNNRQMHHPPYANPPSPGEQVDEERKKVIKASMDWDQATTDIYTTKYGQRFSEIVEAYRSKGIPIGWLDKIAEYKRVPSWGHPQGDLEQFRELAFHVDANDNPIHIPE